MISHPKDVESMYEEIVPESKKDAIEERDNKEK